MTDAVEASRAGSEVETPPRARLELTACTRSFITSPLSALSLRQNGTQHPCVQSVWMARNTGELYVECDIFTVEPNRVVEKQKLVQVSIASGHLSIGLGGLFNVYNPLYRTRMLPSTTACPARGSTSVSASSRQPPSSLCLMSISRRVLRPLLGRYGEHDVRYLPAHPGKSCCPVFFCDVPSAHAISFMPSCTIGQARWRMIGLAYICKSM